MVEAYGGFIEIHIATPIEVCERRDRKGLYAKARKGLIKEFTGIDDPYEVPEKPEMVINTKEISAELSAHRILIKLESMGFVAEPLRTRTWRIWKSRSSSTYRIPSVKPLAAGRFGLSGSAQVGPTANDDGQGITCTAIAKYFSLDVRKTGAPQIQRDQLCMPRIIERLPDGYGLGRKAAVREADDERLARFEDTRNLAKHGDRLLQILDRHAYHCRVHGRVA